jgi:hypothetical protein
MPPCLSTPASGTASPTAGSGRLALCGPMRERDGVPTSFSGFRPVARRGFQRRKRARGARSTRRPARLLTPSPAVMTSPSIPSPHPTSNVPSSQVSPLFTKHLGSPTRLASIPGFSRRDREGQGATLVARFAASPLTPLAPVRAGWVWRRRGGGCATRPTVLVPPFVTRLFLLSARRCSLGVYFGYQTCGRT